VVDVAHDRDDGRPQRELTGVDIFLVDHVAFDRADLDVDVELVGDQLGRGRSSSSLSVAMTPSSSSALITSPDLRASSRRARRPSPIQAHG